MYLRKHDVTVTCSGANKNHYSSEINGRLWEVLYVPGSTPISTANSFKIIRDTTNYSANVILNKHFPPAATRWVTRSNMATSSTQPGNKVATTTIGVNDPWVFANEKCNINIVSSATDANMEVNANFYLYTEPGK